MKNARNIYCSVVARRTLFVSPTSDNQTASSKGTSVTALPPLSNVASLYVHVSCLQWISLKFSPVSFDSCFYSEKTISMFCVFIISKWPYCQRRCSYCNFNKYIPRSVNHPAMTECLQRETETLLKLSQVSRYVR